MTAAVVASRLHFRRNGTVVLPDLTVTIPAGKLTALIGTNGAGKTTFFKLMLGLLTPESGTLSVWGRAPGSDPLAVGYLPEKVEFYPDLTVAEHLAFFASLKGVPPEEAEKLARRLRLTELAGKRPPECSKGQRQRLGLAQALLARPSLLLLDEPTTGLDPRTTQELYAILKEIVASGTTVLLSTHELALAEKHLDCVVMMKSGRCVAGPASLQALRETAAAATAVIPLKSEASLLAAVAVQSGVPYEDGRFTLPEADLPRLLAALADWGVFHYEIVRPDLTALYEYFCGEAA